MSTHELANNEGRDRRTLDVGSGSPSRAIDLVDISRVFRVGRRIITALSHISLDVERGEYISVVGASGSGKSTLLNVISGIDSPSSGDVRILGADLSRMSEDQLAAWRGRNIGIVFQFFQLMPTLTVRENVILPMDLAGLRDRKWARADELLEWVSIAHLSDNLPSELSGGEQQRAAIARALANDPPLLIADEPTGNLDSENGRIVIGIIERLWQTGTTILMVTHDREVARRADRQVSMRDGEIISDVLSRNAAPELNMVASNADAS